MYYDIRLKVTKDTPKGEKEVTERYLTDCGLFAEAETKGLEMYNGACDVVAISRSAVREIVNPDEKGKRAYYRATLADIFTEDDGTEKEQKYPVLIAADTVAEATHMAEEYMRQGLQDMRLDGVVKTKILDIV